MEGFRTPPKLMDERMGHIDGSVQARYSHITRQMREELLAHLTAEWEASLDARLAMCPASPVAMLNDLLTERLRVRRQAPPGSGIPRSSPRFLPERAHAAKQGH
jgi:hypothetical protein